LVAGLSFGVSTALLTHFAWYPDSRMNGMIPALTIGVGFAHAAAGAITGKRLLDTTRTQTSMNAAMLGAGTSLLALGFFAPALAAYVSASDASKQSVLGYMIMTLLTWLFAFLGAGWALLLLSVGVAAVLHRLAST
jgi:hypothetical protein